jgi:hypothetical protein
VRAKERKKERGRHLRPSAAAEAGYRGRWGVHPEPPPMHSVAHALGCTRSVAHLALPTDCSFVLASLAGTGGAS